MCNTIKTKSTRVNYRKIWEEYFGPIPKDSQGKSYHIHHIDGDRNNNEITNLKCVSIEEHFYIHLEQGDWGACTRLAAQMQISAEEAFKLNQQQALARVHNGTHPWIQPEYKEKMRKFMLELVENGKHPLQGENNPIRQRVNNGTHHTLGPDMNRKRVDAGTHNFLGGEIQSKTQQKRIKEGTHNLLGPSNNLARLQNGTHPSQMKKVCPYCNMKVSVANAKRWHFDNCRLKQEKS